MGKVEIVNIGLEDELVDPDFDGAFKLVFRLYGDELDLDNDEDQIDFLTNAIMQTLADTAKRKVTAGEFESRLKLWRKTAENEPNVLIEHYQFERNSGRTRLDASDAAREYVFEERKLQLIPIISGLRYTSLLLCDDPDLDRQLEHGWILGSRDDLYAYAFTTKKQARYPEDMHYSDMRYSCEDLLKASEMHNAHTLVINRYSQNLMLKIEDIREGIKTFNELDEKIAAVICEGLEGDELFPSLMRWYCGRQAECYMKDGTVLCGKVKAATPDVKWDGSFMLETADGDKAIHADDLQLIKLADELKDSRK